MDTKKAIKYLNKVMGYDSDAQCVELLQIIKLLKRGENFEKMWGELEKEKCILIDFNDEGYYKGDHKLSDIKQKYFPKEE